MSNPSAQIEVKMYLHMKGAERNQIFVKIYSTKEIDYIPNDIRGFLKDYQKSISIIIEESGKSIESPEVPKSNLYLQTLPVKQEFVKEDNTLSKASFTQADKDLRFVSAGGCCDVEASAHLVTLDGHTILLDAGYSEKNDLNFREIIEENPEAIFVSHAHLDHVGSLPIIHRMLPTIPIYMTAATKALAYEILEDSLNVASQKGNEPLFTKEEVIGALSAATIVGFNQEFSFNNLKVVFRSAGHILGAGYIVIKGNSSVLYTGDISNSELITASSAFIPETNEKVDLLISESTYGSSIDAEPRSIEVAKFCQQVNAVLGHGGRVLIPSFALGRAQEVLAILLQQMNMGTLLKAPVIIDGLARDIVRCYDHYVNNMPSNIYSECRKSANLRIVGDKIEREQIINDKTPAIVISSSGMLAGGPSVAYAREVLTEEKSAILIVGYVDEETPGKLLAQSKVGDEIELVSEDCKIERIKRKCDVQEYRLSAHSNQQELLKFATSYNPAAVFLVHGEKERKLSLAKALRGLNVNIVLIPENGEKIDVGSIRALKSKIIAEKAQNKTPINLDSACSKAIEQLYEKRNRITLKEFVSTIENLGLLAFSGSPTDTKSLLFALFEWTLRYSQKNEGLEFDFPAQIMRNEVLFLQALYGKESCREFLYEFDSTLPRMFKNFIVNSGRRFTRNYFKIEIASKNEFLYSLKSFKTSFAGMDIVTPNLTEIQNACLYHVRKFPETRTNCIKIFGDSFKELQVQSCESSTGKKPEKSTGDKFAVKEKTNCSPKPSEGIERIEEATNLAVKESHTRRTEEQCIECSMPVEPKLFEIQDGLCKNCWYKKLASDNAKIQRRSGTLGADRASTW